MGSYESQLTVEQVLQEREQKKKAKLEAKQAKKTRKSRATGYVNPKLIAALEYGAEKRRLEAEPASVRIARQQEADLQLAIKLCEEDNRRSADQREAKAEAAEQREKRKETARRLAVAKLHAAHEKTASMSGMPEPRHRIPFANRTDLWEGQHFGLWTVQDLSTAFWDGNRMKVNCKCYCGRTDAVSVYSLKGGKSSSCSHCKSSPFKDLV